LQTSWALTGCDPQGDPRYVHSAVEHSIGLRHISGDNASHLRYQQLRPVQPLIHRALRDMDMTCDGLQFNPRGAGWESAAGSSSGRAGHHAGGNCAEYLTLVFRARHLLGLHIIATNTRKRSPGAQRGYGPVELRSATRMNPQRYPGNERLASHAVK